MKNILLKSLPHLVAVAVFVALSAFYFSPIWDGFELRQGDISHWRGMSKEIADYRLIHGDEPLWSNSMFGGMPAYQISVIHSNNLLSKVDLFLKLGLPYHIGVLFMSMLGFYILALCLRVNNWLGILGGIAFGFATVNILYMGAGHVSKVNSIAYMAPALGGLILATRGKWLLGTAVFALFFGLNVSANHLQMTYYLSFILLAVALTEGVRLIIEKQFAYLAKTTAALAVGAVLSILPSMSNLLTTYEYSKYTTRGKTELTIEPNGEEKPASEKTGLDTDYILEYNFGKGEWWSMVIPNAKGGNSGAIGNDKELLTNVPKQFKENIGQSNRYWGEQNFTGGAFYFGAIIVFLFVMGLMFLKDVLKWPLLVLMVLCIALSSKDPGGLNDFFIHHFPMYNKFRDSKMIMSVFMVIAPLGALLFLDAVLKGEGLIGQMKHRLMGAGALVMLSIVLLAVPSLTGSFLSSAELEQFAEIEKTDASPQEIAMYDDYKTALIGVRKEIFSADAKRTLLLVLVAAGLTIAAMYRKLPAVAIIAVFTIVVAVDQITVCQRYLNNDKVKNQYISYVKPDDKIVPVDAGMADNFILETEKANAPGFDEVKSKLSSIYGESREFSVIRDKNLLENMASFGALGLTTDFRVVTLGNPFSDANTSYYHKSIGGYHGAKLKRYQEVIDFYLMKELKMITDSLRSASDLGILKEARVLNMLNTKYLIYNQEAPPLLNPFAAGNAWFTKDITFVDSANNEMLELGKVNPLETAIVHQEFQSIAGSGVGNDSTVVESSTVVLSKYETNRLEYRANSPVGGAVVFSEIYYPAGWNCYIDGEKKESFRANYVLRGVHVPAGEHTIEWKFEPTTFSQGSTYSLAGSILLMLLVLGAFGMSLKSIKP